MRDESVGEVWHNPAFGDMLVFDGYEWRISRRRMKSCHVVAHPDFEQKWSEYIEPFKNLQLGADLSVGPASVDPQGESK